jgi:hypothetical protein
VDKLIESPIGQMIGGIVAMAVVGTLFALARAGLRALRPLVAKTQTQTDDEILDAAEHAVDDAEKVVVLKVRKP